MSYHDISYIMSCHGHHGISWHIMLYEVLSGYIMLHHVMLWCCTIHRVISFYIMLCHGISWYIMVLSSYIMLYLLYHVIILYTMFHPPNNPPVTLASPNLASSDLLASDPSAGSGSPRPASGILHGPKHPDRQTRADEGICEDADMGISHWNATIYIHIPPILSCLEI